MKLCSFCPNTCHKSRGERVQHRVVEQVHGCASALVHGGNRGACYWRGRLQTLVQASGDSTGGRAHTEEIVDVPVPRILEQIVEVIKVILREQCQ